MKKLVKILSVAAVLLCGIMLTGCGATETIKEYVDSTHRTWYKYNGDSMPIPLSDDADAETSETLDAKKNLEHAEIYVYYDHGLTVAIQSTSQQEVTIAGIINTTQDVVIGGTKKYTEEEFGSGRWTLLLAAAKFKAQTAAPKIVSDPGDCIIIGGENTKNYKIEWKRFLKQQLIETLIGE